MVQRAVQVRARVGEQLPADEPPDQEGRTRSGVLASWPIDDFLTLLGACRRDLTELRGVFGELLAGCRGQADARYFSTEEETERVRQLLERLAPVAGPGYCPVCTQPLPESTRRPRKFCTT
ncbi:hypothetical protein ACFYSF_45815 [Streptomyces canus]|uniref:hypothetical protein n=1 Tax=Streptomyces canus TaxID=58343 RepID=UPI00367AC19A